MKTISKLLTAFLLLALLLAPAMSASASGLAKELSDGKVIFGSNFELAKGETLDGDLVVFGGNVTLAEGSTVKGSLAVIGGNASVAKGATIDGDVAMVGGNMQLDGTVTGSMSMVGGSASLGKTALVDGDVTTMGGNLERAEGAQITGDVIKEGPAPTITIPNQPQAPNAPQPSINFNFDPLSGLLGVFGQAFGVAIIALLASLFLQPQMERVSAVVTSQPLIAGSFGLLTVALAPFVLLILLVTIILSPVALLGAVMIALAWLFGIIALGQEVGERFTRAISQTWSAPVTAGSGTFLLMLVTGVVGLVPCLGWLAPFLVGLVAVGSVALTLFGSRRYPQVLTAVPVDVPPAS
jgi:hypothetical protein